MAYLHRLIFCAFIALMAWVPASSFAAFPAIAVPPPAGSCTVAPCSAWTNNRGGTYSTQMAAAQAVAPFVGIGADATVISLNSPYSCTLHSASYGNYVYPSCTGPITVAPAVTTYSCPSTATLSGSSCSCPAGFVEGGNTCTSSTNVILNALNFVGAPLVGTGPASLSACYQGITVKGTGGTATPDGLHNEVYGPFTSDGTPCTANPNAPVSLSDCPAHSVRGTVMGVSQCSPTSDTNVVAAGPTLAASSPSGAASAPTLGGGAPAGATGSTTGTACTGQKCITTTTFTNASGGTLGTTTKEEPKINFCADNPESSICAKSSISVGSCGSTPACSGDAIQCAVAAQIFKTACALAPDPGQETAAYDAAKGLTGNQTTNLPGNGTVNISSGSFDQSEFLGAAVGVQDLTVTVAHKLVTLPISQVNVWLARLGSLLQAVTFLVCLKIVTREA